MVDSEKIVALVVDDDEGREILHLDLPHGFHAELWVLEHLDLLDAVLREPRRRSADAAEVEAAVLLTRGGHGAAAVALGQHHQRAAGGLEGVDVGVHAPRRRRTKAPRGHAHGRLGGTRVIDRVILQVLRHAQARVEALLDLGVGDVARDHHRSAQAQARLHGELGEDRSDLAHGPREIDLDHLPTQRGVVDVGEILRRIASSSSRNTPSLVIFPQAWRSAEHETATPMGHEAPWRGKRITRTSWQKYLPPNCAPMPVCCERFKNSPRARRRGRRGPARCPVGASHRAPSPTRAWPRRRRRLRRPGCARQRWKHCRRADHGGAFLSSIDDMLAFLEARVRGDAIEGACIVGAASVCGSDPGP